MTQIPQIKPIYILLILFNLRYPRHLRLNLSDHFSTQVKREGRRPRINQVGAW
jgi:hypothetical protein